jgi:hypothetical protein
MVKVHPEATNLCPQYKLYVPSKGFQQHIKH